MPRFVHIDIAADDPRRGAVRFFEDVFGWTITKWDGPEDYWLIETGEADEPGIDAGLGQRQSPEQLATPMIEVPSVDDAAAKIVSEGGTIVHAKMPIPEVGFILWFRDTEGNVFALLEPEAQAT